MDPLLDSAPFGFLVVRDDGYVEIANRTLADMLDTTAAALVESHVDNIFTTPSRIFYQSHVFPTLKLQNRVNEVYLSLKTAKGEELPVLLNAKRRETQAGARSDWAVVAMKQRNEYENEILKARRIAEEASVAKDNFLSFVSHELRSPLTAIKNWAALLASEKLDAEKVKRGIAAIDRNADLQVKLVNDILDHARLATGKVRVELAPLDARAILTLVLDGVEPTAHAKGIALERDLQPGSMQISADAERLQQMFWNVLTNAIKFTRAHGRVHVTLGRTNGWVEVTVTDSGKGIAPEFLPYVFESFRQEEGRVTRAEGGLGLGMSITRQLVELHGGSISAASAGLEKGATFTIRLPALEKAGDATDRKRELSEE
jgi:signal transduction histidine kinase